MSFLKKHFFGIEPLEARIAPAFAAVFELSSLDGLNGFKLSGVAAGDHSGASVSDAGDVNGDGFDDVIIGAYGADPNGSNSGASYVVFGKASGFAANLNLSALDGSNGFKLSGVAAGDGSGFSASAAGDVNGDGFDDLIIGANLADPNGSLSGASYVVFGKASGFAASLNLSTLNGSNGFKLSGVAANDESGVSVGAAGDVNGDGVGDLIIGAPGADPNGSFSGASYVVFGKASGFAANLNLSTLNGSNGFKLSGVAAYDQSGVSVSGAGDVNGDGFDDLIIGANLADPNGSFSGASYVVFGKASAFPAVLNVSTLNGANGFKVSGVSADDGTGRSVSAAGDVNGDGFGDLIIGANGADPNADRSGASYVVFGKASGFAANLNLSTLNGSNGFKLSGVAANDLSGASVSGAGDVNGDGLDDLVISAIGADPNGSGSGASYVVFGKVESFAANLELSTLDGSNGFRLSGVAQGDESGSSVSGAGDVNGDGVDDLIIGARETEPSGADSGASYVVFGQGSGPIEVSVSDAEINEGNGGTAALQFAVSLSRAATGPLSVEVAAADGSALAGSDYAPFAPMVVTFAAGERTKTVTVDIIGDTLYEASETFSVVLSNASGGVIKDGTGIGTIINDDVAPLVSIAGNAVLEGDSGTSSLAFTVSLSAASGLPATVRYASADGTAVAGSDYTALSAGALNFAPGETTKTISVEVLGDTSIEDHEQFSVVLTEPSGATVGTGTAVGTILNDDTAIRIDDVSATEGDSGTTPFGFTVSLEKASALPVTVNYTSADGTANAGTDFIAVPADSQITFAPGEISKTITVEVMGDTDIEPDESFSVVLSAATNATIAKGTGTGTILDDDALIPLVQISDASVLEGHSGTRAMTFLVSLSAETTRPVSVNFASADGTATAGTDYTALTAGTLNFAPGETTKTVTVDVRGDILVDPSETFSVLLSEAMNAVIEDGTGLGTILDDDVTLLGKRKATFIDVDGEQVTIKVSKGTLKVEDFTIFPSGSGAQLALVDFSGETVFSGANLSISAKGGGAVDVGYINATGIDLGAVAVRGDLGQIDVGNPADQKAALRSLSATSLGGRGLETQLPGGSLQSDIEGALKKLKLANGMHDVTLSVSGDIAAVKIKGDVLGSAIQSDGKIGTMKIGGDLAASDLNAATLSARGNLSPTSSGKAMAIANLSIGGSIDHAQILAGYDRTGTGANADAGIGAVIVGGNWIASNLIAGVNAGPDGLFGTDDDAAIAGTTPIVSRIASILIKGTATGTEGGTDHFGFVAGEIGALKAGGSKFSLTPGPGNDLAGLAVGATGDLRVREVA